MPAPPGMICQVRGPDVIHKSRGLVPPSAPVSSVTAIWGIVVPVSVQAIKWTVPEMWLSACVGCGFREADNYTGRDPFSLVEID